MTPATATTGGEPSWDRRREHLAIRTIEHRTLERFLMRNYSVEDLRRIAEANDLEPRERELLRPR